MYHEVWFIQIVEQTLFGPSPYQFLYHLKMHPVEQIREQGPPVTRFDWSSNSYGMEWESFVANDHTRLYLDQPIEKIMAIREVLQTIRILLFPNWIMDRFKEAMDQYVRGEWLSSISLCGDIVEFIVNEFWGAYYPDPIPSDQPKAPRRVRHALNKLSEFDVLKEEDHKLLAEVRQRRDDHVHNYPRNMFLVGDYPLKLKSDSLQSLTQLSQFFSRSNIESKYGRFLEYAMKFATVPSK